jgi:hypothetical protein
LSGLFPGLPLRSFKALGFGFLPIGISTKNLPKFRGGVRETGVAVWNERSQRFNSPSPYVVSLLAPFTLVTAITERLKVRLVQCFAPVLDGDYMVDNLGRVEADNADRIASDEPSS